MKKVLSWMLVFGLLWGVLLQTAVPANAMPTGQEQQTMEAMNGLLTGITGDMINGGDVENWTNESISRMISNKMMWDRYQFTPWLPTLGIPTDTSGDGYIHVERSLVDQLVKDAFGREFVPVELPYMLQLSGSEVLFGEAAGEHSSVVIQDYIERGNYYIAVGCSAWFGGAGSAVNGYFQAVFRKNPDSLYGMTLVSMKKISGNQSFSHVSAEASSVLSGGDYKAANVLDGKESTAWVEGTGGTGTGEFVELNTADGSAMKVCAIEIDPGYHKSDDILYKNGWPTKIRIETGDGVAIDAYCYSTETQTILLESPAETQSIRITILEAQAGTKYSDTCISEIRLKGMDTDAYFSNLDIDLPEDEPATETTPVLEDAPAPDDLVPAETETPADEPAPDTPTAPEATDDEAPDEGDTGEEASDDRSDDKQIIVLDIMDDWDLAEFLEENLLLVILVGTGSLIVAAGIAVLIIVLRKKK